MNVAQLVMELKDDQRGPAGTYRGALKVDGELFCPQMPTGLHNLPDADYRNVQQMQARAAVADRRQPYRMLPLTQPDGNGTQRMQCPAQRGQLRCPLKPDSLQLDPGEHQTVVDPPGAPGACCTQSSITVQPAVLGRIKQEHPYGTLQHKASFDRRNVVEGAIALLKSSGGQDVKRDHIRVMGLAANTLLLTFAVAALNVRLLANHLIDVPEQDAQQAADADPVPGSYDAVIATDRAFTERRRAREAAAAAQADHDPPEVA